MVISVRLWCSMWAPQSWSPTARKRVPRRRSRAPWGSFRRGCGVTTQPNCWPRGCGQVTRAPTHAGDHIDVLCGYSLLTGHLATAGPNALHYRLRHVPRPTHPQCPTMKTADSSVVALGPRHRRGRRGSQQYRCPPGHLYPPTTQERGEPPIASVSRPSGVPAPRLNQLHPKQPPSTPPVNDRR